MFEREGLLLAAGGVQGVQTGVVHSVSWGRRLRRGGNHDQSSLGHSERHDRRRDDRVLPETTGRRLQDLDLRTVETENRSVSTEVITYHSFRTVGSFAREATGTSSVAGETSMSMMTACCSSMKVVAAGSSEGTPLEMGRCS